MDNTALCQITLMLHNLLILLIILVLFITSVTPTLCSLTSQSHLIWSTIPMVIEKLRYAGIGGTLFAWFNNYLEGRLQGVVINGPHSASLRALS